MNDYYFFRFMHSLIWCSDVDELAKLHGIAEALPESDIDRDELLSSVADRCHVLQIPVPAPVPPKDFDWSRLFPSFSSDSPDASISIDADPWNADWLRQDLPSGCRTEEEFKNWIGRNDKKLLEFRATPLYARVRNKYPWLREAVAG